MFYGSFFQVMVLVILICWETQSYSLTPSFLPNRRFIAVKWTMRVSPKGGKSIIFLLFFKFQSHPWILKDMEVEVEC